MTIASFTNVNKSYHTGEVLVPVLRDITVAVDAEDMVAFVGPSGSGKTTMLNLFGLLDAPDSGSITLDGTATGNADKNRRAELRNEKLGFIFQSFNLIPVLTAFENVEFPLIISGMRDYHIRRDMTMEMLRRVGIDTLSDRMPSQLSGGQQQRVAIARALVKRPRLVLADEPTANLDSKSAGETLDVMRAMNDELKTTFIFSTHDAKIMQFAKRVVTLVDGTIAGDVRK
ncbi:MAG: ABC transporter ATP-binding protein [Spirochaetes bacterium]|nr:ABC transporter ATP-binding protein [Spirochaetota bacterium]